MRFLLANPVSMAGCVLLAIAAIGGGVELYIADFSLVKVLLPIAGFGFAGVAGTGFGTRTAETYRNTLKQLQNHRRPEAMRRLLEQQQAPCVRTGMRLAIKDFERAQTG